MPVIETVLVDRKDLPSAGAGETPIVGVAPAISNAIFSATGVRLRDMPLLGPVAARKPWQYLLSVWRARTCARATELLDIVETGNACVAFGAALPSRTARRYRSAQWMRSASMLSR